MNNSASLRYLLKARGVLLSEKSQVSKNQSDAFGQHHHRPQQLSRLLSVICLVPTTTLGVRKSVSILKMKKHKKHQIGF